MTFHRFFIDSSCVHHSIVKFPKDVSQQITKVLRLRRGDYVIVLDGKLTEYQVVLDQMISTEVIGKILVQTVNQSEPNTYITLYQSLTPRDKFETILQKGTELGISCFVPIETKRSLIKRNDLKPDRFDRWKRIIQEAAEQSERGRVPELKETLKFEDAIVAGVAQGIVLLAWEQEADKKLSSVLADLKDEKSLAIFIGPEGGFELSEIAFAYDKGVQTVGLGPRVLRTETAGPTLASLILFQLGDLDRDRTIA